MKINYSRKLFLNLLGKNIIACHFFSFQVFLFKTEKTKYSTKIFTQCKLHIFMQAHIFQLK